jgi:hypothetical protein
MIAKAVRWPPHRRFPQPHDREGAGHPGARRWIPLSGSSSEEQTAGLRFPPLPEPRPFIQICQTENLTSITSPSATW